MKTTAISQSQIRELVQQLRTHFQSGQTKSIHFRKEALHKLKKAILKYEHAIAEALMIDLNKSYEESYLTEISLLLGEIDLHLKHLDKWAKPKRIASPIKMFPSYSRLTTEPLGCTLIIAPWNYPFQLLINPLIGAISGGCTALLKPSPYTPHVAAVTEQLIAETFPEHYISVVQGDKEVNTWLLQERFDLIFFTGSPLLGRVVMEAAAKHLTPVILELGGKSPCIVDADAQIGTIAKRIAWGKCLNAGQTCIAPDYLLVHKSVKTELIKALTHEFKVLLGSNPKESKHYVRIVNDRAFERLVGYLKQGDIVAGGTYEADSRYIEPTLLDNVSVMAEVMQEEIFGPIFPIIPFDNRQEAIRFVAERPKPLALYYFGGSAGAKEVLHNTSSGGACINDTIMHIVNERMPFGGVGNSGMGHYHGHYSFLAFSHQRAVVTTPTWIDVPFRYMPYKYFKATKWLM